MRNWIYFMNMIDLVDGLFLLVVLWVIVECVDKCWFFVELGFLFGVLCVWFKVFLCKQLGLLIGFMDNVFLWLLVVMMVDLVMLFCKFDDVMGLVLFLVVVVLGVFVVLLCGIVNVWIVCVVIVVCCRL